MKKQKISYSITHAVAALKKTTGVLRRVEDVVGRAREEYSEMRYEAAV